MYCSGCGTQILQGLNYCNRCGKRVSEERADALGISPDIAKAVGYVASGGFFAFIFVVFIFLRAGAPANQLVPITFFFFAALFGICFLILHFGKGFERKPEKPPVQGFDVAEPRSYIEPPSTARLTEPADPGIASVTEHTTRTLDEVPVRKN
jgi:hypothetical protein